MIKKGFIALECLLTLSLSALLLLGGIKGLQYYRASIIFYDRIQTVKYTLKKARLESLLTHQSVNIRPLVGSADDSMTIQWHGFHDANHLVINPWERAYALNGFFLFSNERYQLKAKLWINRFGETKEA